MSEELWARTLDVFRLLLEATRAKKVSWADNGNDIYHSDDLPGCYIKLFHTKFHDHEVKFADPGRVEIGVGRTSGVYYIGSEGYSLAVAILAAGLPNWGVGSAASIAGVDEALSTLERLLDNRRA